MVSFVEVCSRALKFNGYKKEGDGFRWGKGTGVLDPCGWA